MDTLPAAEAKASFDQILDRAARGETIVITRDGRPVAEMRPAAAATPDTDAAERRRRAIEDWIARKDQWPTLGATTIRELRDAGRRS